MRRPYSVIKTFIFVSLAIVVISCHIQPGDAYSIHINTLRLSKDSFLKWSDESPLNDAQKKDFTELKYFAPDSNYVISANVEKIAIPDTLKMEDTKGDNIDVIRYAKLHFNLHGRPYTLCAYKQVKMLKDSLKSETMFVPFYDSTNGNESHEGGRYLDIEYKGGKVILLDFNMAYSPYCAYSSDFSCPIPPAENRLKAGIRAGEKEVK